jgi:hypothetical protein
MLIELWPPGGDLWQFPAIAPGAVMLFAGFVLNQRAGRIRG